MSTRHQHLIVSSLILVASLLSIRALSPIHSRRTVRLKRNSTDICWREKRQPRSAHPKSLSSQLSYICSELLDRIRTKQMTKEFQKLMQNFYCNLLTKIHQKPFFLPSQNFHKLMPSTTSMSQFWTVKRKLSLEDI
jgi:hypothetical protein